MRKESSRAEKIKNRMILVLAMVTTSVYIVWRIVFSLPWDYGFVDIFFGILLLIAELVGFIETFNYINTSGGVEIPELPQIPLDEFPDVDVFIATYNEETELLVKTVNGCLNMDYPDKSKVHIYLCDDGGRSEVEAMAQEMGVGYFKRDDHEGAKAGNLNNAMAHTSSPYIATFDADMIPMHDFLMKVMPYFFRYQYEKDENGKWVKSKTPEEEQKKVGFVQTPQSFYNSDLFQYNLYSEDYVPNEQDFFFRTIQACRNKNNAAIYAGSNTVLSRQALEDVGGFYDKSITEDLATGLNIQTSGYDSIALDEVHANGLAPIDVESLFKQRSRWARGCIQTMRQMHIFFRKGLDFKQRFAYICCLLYWYTPIRRVIFIISPILYALFNVHLLQCELWELIVIWLPHYVFYTLEQSNLSVGKRTSRLSNVYDTILCWNLVPSVILETLCIKKSKFEVTRKKKTDDGSDSKMKNLKFAMPHIIMIILSIVSLIICVHGTVISGTMMYIIIIFWIVVNLYSLLMACFFLMGRKSNRQTERYMVSVPVVIHADDETDISARTIDLSEGGFAFSIKEPRYITKDEDVCIDIQNEDGRYHASLKGRVAHVKKSGDCFKYSIQITEICPDTKLEFLQIVYDRLPSLPVIVDPKTGFVDDLKNNISRRNKKAEYSDRRLPRLDIDKEFLSEPFGSVRVHNFNYEFAVLELPESSEKIKLKIDNERTMLLSCERIISLGKKELYLYRIDNKDEFIRDEKFINMLIEWEKQAEKRARERAKTARKMMVEDRDEFREEKYL